MFIELITFALFTLPFVLFYFYFSYDVGYNPADGGYLLYGTLRVLEGEVPIRDFRAYDPWRYYWCAIFANIFGGNLLSIRYALIAWTWLTLSFASFMLFQVISSWLLIGVFLIVALFWITPIHKAIDSCVPLISIFLFFLVVKDPSSLVISLAVGWIGFTLLIGANHFLYNSIAFLGILLFVFFKIGGISFFEIVEAMVLGGSLGLLPFILFLVCTKSQKIYYQQKIEKILKRGTTNLKKTIPLPWHSIPKNIQENQVKIYKILALKTIALPVFYVLAITYVCFWGETKANFLLFTAASVGLIYLNHYFSRADKSHLTVSSLPYLLASFVFSPCPFFQVLLCGYIIYLTYVFVGYPYYQMLTLNKYGPEARKLDSEVAPIWLRTQRANHFEQLIKKIKTNSAADSNIFLAPLHVGFFPLLGKKSEVYDTFPVYPAKRAEQLKMIEEIEAGNIKLAFVLNFNLDGRADLRFEHSFPLVWSFLLETFSRIDSKPFEKNFNFFKRIEM